MVSKHFNTKRAVRGRLFHQPRDTVFKARWFIYQICDENCWKTYVESTVDMYGRWANHKLDCNRGSTAIGFPGDTDRDYMDATGEEEQGAHHGGVGCVCTLCRKLKTLEDNWIIKLGCFYHPNGLNKRDEIKIKKSEKQILERGRKENLICLSVFFCLHPNHFLFGMKVWI